MELSSVTALPSQMPIERTVPTSAHNPSHPKPFVMPEAPTGATQPPKKPDAASLEQAISSTNKVLASKTSNELHFAVDKSTGMTVVKLMNRQTGETILQFPSEAMLQIAKGIDKVGGALIQRKA